MDERKFLHRIVKQECDIIDRHIQDSVFFRDLPFVAENHGFSYSVVRCCEEVVKSAVNLVVLSGFHLYRKN